MKGEKRDKKADGTINLFSRKSNVQFPRRGFTQISGEFTVTKTDTIILVNKKRHDYKELRNATYENDIVN